MRRPRNFNQNLPVFLKLIFINFNSKRLEEFCCLVRNPELYFTNCLKIISIEVQPRWYLPLLLPFFVITFFIPNKIYNIFFIFKIMNNGYNSFLISQSKFNIKYFQKKMTSPVETVTTSWDSYQINWQTKKFSLYVYESKRELKQAFESIVHVIICMLCNTLLLFLYIATVFNKLQINLVFYWFLPRWCFA